MLVEFGRKRLEPVRAAARRTFREAIA
jgi:hypothetical protein